ncbi:MAG: STAS domain-containing protein [Terricaulis silvestris]
MDLAIEETADGVVVAVLKGRMDIDGALGVDMRFNALGGVPNRKLVVDMAGVDFIASMGLRTLMTCAKAITAKGGRMAVAAPQANVMRVLETSGVAEIVRVSPTRDAAIAVVSG